jgi:predicted nucleotidyltransferase
MVDIADIFRFVDGIEEKIRPRRVVLFGSYAYGVPTEDSDVDLLVVKNYRGSSHLQSVKIRTALPHLFPMDLLVRSDAEIKRRIGWNDFFLQEIMEKGLVLYAADDPRMGEQGRRRLRRRFRAAASYQKECTAIRAGVARAEPHPSFHISTTFPLIPLRITSNPF